MAKRTKTTPKSPIKPVFFDMNNEEERSLRAHADAMENYSRFVKEKLAEDMRSKDLSLIKETKLDPQEIAYMVQQLVRTELAGHIIATDQDEFGPGDVPDMDQFF